MKSTLTFYTNIISPYQLNFFDELATRFSLKVVFYSQSESDREWELAADNLAYETVVLRDVFFIKAIQKFMPSFHFSFQIFWVSIKDNSSSVILGGNYFIPNTLITLSICAAKRKNIYWFGERLLPSGPTKKIIKKIMLKPIMRFTKAIFAVGEEAINSYISYGYTKSCFNIPYNIADQNFDSKNLNIIRLENLRKKYNPYNKLIILTSGSLIERKGMDTAIKAFQGISDTIRVNSELWILGDGIQRHELEKRARGSENIRFLGFLNSEDIPLFFAMADIFLFCSRYDGWAVVINEALSASLPVVTSNAATASELIVSGETGYVHDAEAITEYTASLELLLSNERLRSEMAIRAKSVAIAWNSSAMADRVLDIIANDSLVTE